MIVNVEENLNKATFSTLQQKQFQRELLYLALTFAMKDFIHIMSFANLMNSNASTACPLAEQLAYWLQCPAPLMDEPNAVTQLKKKDIGHLKCINLQNMQ